MTSKPQKVCYFCGAQATSREHIPPKQMFRGFPDRRSIKVPACEQHNNAKSGNDVAVIKAFLQTLYLTQNTYPVASDVAKAISIAKGEFQQVKNVVKPAKILSDFDQEVTHIAPSVNIKLWVCQLTAGIVWKMLDRFEPQIVWHDARIFSPDWVPANNPEPQEASYVINHLTFARDFREGAKRREWQLGPFSDWYPASIYKHWLDFADEAVVFKHTFYGKFDWYVFLYLAPELIRELFAKIPK